MKKWIAALLCIALLLGLAACSQPASQPQNGESNSNNDNSNNPAASLDVFGMLMLNMNAIVNISYDKDGLVLSVTSGNLLGDEIVSKLSAVLGSSCSKVVCDLITAADKGAYAQEQNAVLLKQVNGSQNPSEAFLEDIRLDAQKVAGERTVIAVAADTLTEDGYLPLEIAKELLTKQLGVEEAALEGDPIPQDGLYWISVRENDIVTQCSVDADLGTIEMLPAEPDEDSSAQEGDEFYDPTMNMTPDDTSIFEEFIGDPFENDGEGIIFDEEGSTDGAA